MTVEELDVKLNNLHYELDDLYGIIMELKKEWFEKGNYISVLRLHTISVRIWDLLDNFDDFTEIEKSIIGELKL